MYLGEWAQVVVVDNRMFLTKMMSVNATRGGQQISFGFVGAKCLLLGGDFDSMVMVVFYVSCRKTLEALLQTLLL